MDTDAKLRADLRRITARRAQLEEQERVLVTQARERQWSWEELAELLAISRPGLQKRYRGILPSRTTK